MEHFRFLFFIASLLAMAPFYSFDRRALLRPKFHKAYPIVIVSVLITWRCYFYCQDYAALVKGWSFTRVFLMVLDELILIAMYCCQMLSSCVFKREEWLEMNNTLLMFDDAPEKMKGYRPRKEPPWFRATFLTYHAIVLAMVLFMGANASTADFIRYVWYQGTLYPSFLITLTIQYLSLSFTEKYEELNALLLENLDKTHDASDAKRLRLLKNRFRLLRRTVCRFNEVFGYPLLFIVAKFVVFSLRMLEMSIYRTPVLDGRRPVSKYLPVCLTVTIIASLTCTLIMVMSCDSMRAVQQRTRTICNRLEEGFQEVPEVKLEVERLSGFLRDNPARFTAADFFEVDRTTVFGMFGIIATYLIVILQFNHGN